MKKGVGIILFVICVSLAINFISAAAIDEELHLNIQVINSSGSVEIGTFDFEFNISTLVDCSNVVYTNRTNLTTDSRGIISYYLENVNLDFSEQYWLCYYRDDVLINASKIARTPYSFTAMNISAGGIINDSNVNLVGKNITADYGFFSYLGSLANRITTLFVQNINASGNITANYFLGDGSLLTGIEGASNSSSWNRSSTNVILHHLADRVGIGTNSPTHGLNVFGTTNLSGDVVMEGDVDFNGGWMNGGVSIGDGDLYAQTVYVYNLSSLNLDTLNVNGSLLPTVGFDNIFDIGNASLRWRDIHIGGEIHSNGTGDNYFLGNVGIGITAPLHPLQVSLDTDYFLVSDSGDSDNYRAKLGDSDGNGGYFILFNESESANVMFRSYGDSYVMGDLGIGITTPSTALEVNGNITTECVIFPSGGKICSASS